MLCALRVRHRCRRLFLVVLAFFSLFRVASDRVADCRQTAPNASHIPFTHSPHTRLPPGWCVLSLLPSLSLSSSRWLRLVFLRPVILPMRNSPLNPAQRRKLMCRPSWVERGKSNLYTHHQRSDTERRDNKEKGSTNEECDACRHTSGDCACGSKCAFADPACLSCTSFFHLTHTPKSILTPSPPLHSPRLSAHHLRPHSLFSLGLFSPKRRSARFAARRIRHSITSFSQRKR